MTQPGTDLAIPGGNGIQPARPHLALAFQGAADLDSWISVVENIAAFAEQICRTSFVPKSYRNDAASVAAAILVGRELGLPPMTALRHVQVVEGSPGLSAEYKRARVLAAGHRLDITEHTTEACTVTGHRKGHEPVTVRYTMKDARTAGLVKDRGAWMTRPRRMLFARASTEVVDALFSDLTNGLPTAELLEDDAEGYNEQAPPAPRVTAQEIQARAARNADRVTGEVIPDGAQSPAPDVRPTAEGRLLDPRDDVLGHFARLAVTGPDIPAYLTRLSGRPYASVESLSRAAAGWFNGRLAKTGTRDELEAAAVAAEARREQDSAAEAGDAPADGEVPGHGE